jgi:hypothetical protein
MPKIKVMHFQFSKPFLGNKKKNFRGGGGGQAKYTGINLKTG